MSLQNAHSLEQASALADGGDLHGADRLLRELLAVEPDRAEAWHLLGIIALKKGRQDEAEEHCRKAIALEPDRAGAHYHLGHALLVAERWTDALLAFDRAIALDPQMARAYSSRGWTLAKLRLFKRALTSIDKALTLHPDLPQALLDRASVLTWLGRPEEALAYCDRALAHDPQAAEAYIRRSIAVLYLDPQSALRDCDRALALAPALAHAHWNRAWCLLLTEQFEDGWREYEWRRKLNRPIGVRDYAAPLWQGREDISGKTLFVYWEQGLGDTMQFCRYAPLAAARGARVVLCVQEPLVRLLRGFAPNVEVIGPTDATPQFDLHCPLHSLPYALSSSSVAIPNIPHLAASPALRAAWANRLPPRTRPRIGLAWSGAPVQLNDHQRSMALRQILPLVDVRAEWMCLQKTIRSRDVELFHADGRIAFHGDALNDFADTAALLDQMDLVVTTDNSIANLAGSMGKPVWVILGHAADWRWLLDRADTPWYPTARLYRAQRQDTDWQDVVERVLHDLQTEMLSSKT